MRTSAKHGAGLILVWSACFACGDDAATTKAAGGLINERTGADTAAAPGAEVPEVAPAKGTSSPTAGAVSPAPVPAATGAGAVTPLPAAVPLGPGKPTASPGAGTPSTDSPVVSGEASDPSGGGSTVLMSDGASGSPLAPPATSPASPLPPKDGSDTTLPAAQAGTLTAGVWDDNKNFGRFTNFKQGFTEQQTPGLLEFSDKDYQAAKDLADEPAGPKQKLDIALVIDTTGSMGDELRYLQTELLALSNRIAETYPDAEQHWALVFYRDQGDLYTVRPFDFASDLSTVQANLAAQKADGGGDFPESPNAALAAMNDLAWRGEDDVARLAFWVADAPYHALDASAMSSAIVGAQKLGVHIYPVASSGIDEFTELGMRSSAQLTGGRYLFLTNDSGVGGDHKEPSIPCYFVTRLDVAISRMVNIEMTGTYSEPDSADVIRTGGNPKDGACSLDSGATAFVF